MSQQINEPTRQKPIANLTKREMEKMARTLHERYAAAVFETDDGFWTIEFSFYGQEILRYGIETNKGLLKVWRNLSDAMMFVKENCAGAEKIYVDFHGWRFIRLEASD